MSPIKFFFTFIKSWFKATYEVWRDMGRANHNVRQMFVTTAKGEYLDQHAQSFGITRKPAKNHWWSKPESDKALKKRIWRVLKGEEK